MTIALAAGRPALILLPPGPCPHRLYRAFSAERPLADAPHRFDTGSTPAALEITLCFSLLHLDREFSLLKDEIKNFELISLNIVVILP
ncbi:MAG: hypothetical protein ABI893_02655 [Polaromonas sp.]|uniref:hypothetical protein n=1 Tax=Polaromonas sp. TaxID=1869339 RepID=UPI0032634715